MRDAKDAVTRPRDDGTSISDVKRRGERLIGLLIAGAALLNFPLLSVFNVRGLVCGIPILYCYLFSVWLLLLGVTALILRDRPNGPRGDPQEPRE
jgi:hypothetical protein